MALNVWALLLYVAVRVILEPLGVANVRRPTPVEASDASG